jgi:MFS transporter, DHA1 family, multidrug resistance protein
MEKNRLARWRLNLVVLCLAQVLTQMGFSAYLPSLAYHVQELLGGGYEQATSWVAALNSVDAFAMMAVAPIWGLLADRYGRKLMMVRATLAGAMLVLPMAFVSSPGQMVVLRALQGIFCGTVSAAMTLVATETPDEHLGFALGLMQVAQFVGRAVGPLAGGIVADTLGYTALYAASAGLMGLAFLGIALLVRERFTRPTHEVIRGRRAWGAGLVGLLTGSVLALLLAMWAMSFAVGVLGPILALYVKSLSPETSHIATLSGATMSVTALTSSLAALGMGRLGDRYGQKQILTVCIITAAAICVPQAFVRTPMQLVILRAIEGIFLGGMTPAANALLARCTDPARRGAVFGLSSSVGSAGRAMGPLAGAGAANTWGMASAFLVASGAYAVTAAVVAWCVRSPSGRSSPAQAPVSVAGRSS